MHDNKDRNRQALRLQTYFACLLLLGASACSGAEATPPGGDSDDDGEETDNSGAADDDDAEDDDTTPGDPPDADDDDGDDDDDTQMPPPKNDAGTPRIDGGNNPPRIDGSTTTPPSTTDAGNSGTKTDGGDSTTPPPPAAGDCASCKREPSVGVKGPYTVKTYTEGLREGTYSSSIMYYPENIEGTIGAVAFSPGFTATKENYTFLGDLLASNGFAALLTSPTSTSDFPPARGMDLQAAVAKIKAENTREGSPLKGKLNGKICVTGHSMGGGGTLHGATSLGTQIACAVPLQPWEPGTSFGRIMAPTLFIGAQSDTTASVSGNAQPHYRSIPNSVEKILAVVQGADHFYSTNQNRNHTVEAHVMVAWYHVHLDGDMRYREYLYGSKKGTGFSTYTTSKMQ